MPHPQLLDTQVWTAPPNLRSDYPGDPMRFLGMRLLTQYHAANEETHKLLQKQSEFDWPHVACLTLGWSFGQMMSSVCHAELHHVQLELRSAKHPKLPLSSAFPSRLRLHLTDPQLRTVSASVRRAQPPPQNSRRRILARPNSKISSSHS